MKTSMQPERAAGNQRDADAMSVVLLSKRELSAILAGLRMFEAADRANMEPMLQDIATDCGTLAPMSAAEVCELCERINVEPDDGFAMNVAGIASQFTLRNETHLLAAIGSIYAAAVALTLIERDGPEFFWDAQKSDWESVCFAIAKRIDTDRDDETDWDAFIRSLL